MDEIESALSRGETIQNLIPHIEITVASIINQLLFGFAYHEKADVERFTKIKETLNKHMQVAMHPSTLFAMHYPNIAPYLPILKDSYHGFIEGYKVITEYAKEQIAAHKASRSKSKDAEPSDYVDAYLREAEIRGVDSTFTETQVREFSGILVFSLSVWCKTSGSSGFGFLFVREVESRIHHCI